MREETIQQLLNQLKVLEMTLFQQGLWAEESPEPHRLMSSEPFCVDTLHFNEWLQWIFIPKLTEMLSDNQFMGLPNQSDIHGMASEVYKEQRQELAELLVILKEIDKLLNSFDVQTSQ